MGHNLRIENHSASDWDRFCRMTTECEIDWMERRRLEVSGARPMLETDRWRLRASSTLGKVEVGKVHIAAAQDMHRQNASSRGQSEFQQASGDVPVMPLSPGNRVRRIEGRLDGKRPGCGLPIHIDGDRSASVGGVEKIGAVDASTRHLYCDVEPLSGLGPAYVKLVLAGLDQLVWAVVDLIMKFGVGDIDALVHAELIEIASIGGVECSTAVVLAVGVMIGDSFSAKIVEGALDPSRNLLRFAWMASIYVGPALVLVRIGGCRCGDGRRGDEQGEE
jgi:hypothetical protein